MRPLPEFVDEALWFTTEHGGPGKRYYLLRSNPHTFRGRMNAFDADAGEAFCISKHEIVTMSPEARYFIDGFLVGNQPAPPTDGDGDPLPDDHPTERLWRRAVAKFNERGFWGPDTSCEGCGAAMLPADPPGLLCARCVQSSL